MYKSQLPLQIMILPSIVLMKELRVKNIRVIRSDGCSKIESLHTRWNDKQFIPFQFTFFTSHHLTTAIFNCQVGSIQRRMIPSRAAKPVCIQEKPNNIVYSFWSLGWRKKFLGLTAKWIPSVKLGHIQGSLFLRFIWGMKPENERAVVGILCTGLRGCTSLICFRNISSDNTRSEQITRCANSVPHYPRFFFPLRLHLMNRDGRTWTRLRLPPR